MFAALLSRLTGDADAALAPDDAEPAVAALLIRVARADQHYTDGERRMVERLLAPRNPGADPATLRAAAEALEADSPDTVRLTRRIKAAIPLEQRRAVVAALWAVALQDGRRQPEEEAELRLIAGLLGVNDRDSALARQSILAAGDSSREGGGRDGGGP